MHITAQTQSMPDDSFVPVILMIQSNERTEEIKLSDASSAAERDQKVFLSREPSSNRGIPMSALND